MWAVEKQWGEVLAGGAISGTVWGAEGSKETGRIREGARNGGRGDGMWG